MDDKKINRIFAGLAFLFSFIVYYLTVAPTVSFWDCGEFISCSYRLAVPHPPGAPLYLLVGRIFSLLPIFGDIAKRLNFISVLSSAFTVMFLYLVIVMMIKKYLEGSENGFMRFVPYVGGIVGSLTFAYSTSFWFNAVESEVYAPSMFFTAFVVWLIMFWSERSQEIGNERYILVIMYLVGLALGAHLLNVLALPMVFLLIYYKKYLINRNTFIYLILVGLMLTGMIYPGIVNGIPLIAEIGGFFSLVILIFALLFILAYAVSNHKEILSIILTSILLVILGYSTYTLIYIRSNLDPNIDENNPETIEKFISYMNREQYGEHTFDRKKVLADSPNGKQYTGVWDFFWNYQVNKMYIRYFFWNFIGQDHVRGNVNFTLWGIPFLLGLLGAVYHAWRDWKHGLAVFVLFFMTGLAIILYLNQPDPQPRERDYSYVGSFFAFSIWIGIGAAAIVEWFVKGTKEGAVGNVVPLAMTAFLILISPVKVLVENYKTHDRSGNYVAWDYSYNMLITCEENGILYTNGDNDTFPLWYLQEVEEIRTDVRVANLSLLNTNWYISQLKHMEPKVPISLSDAEIENIMPVPWPEKRTLEIKLPENVVEREREAYLNNFSIKSSAIDDDRMKFELESKLFNRYLRVQDYMVLNILYANKFKKPLYFGVTVSRDNMLDGLQKYIRMDGTAFRITTQAGWSMDPDILYDNLMNKYQYRNLDNPKVYYNPSTEALLQNYRSAFLQLANYYAIHKDKEKIKTLMLKMREVMPDNVIPHTSPTIRNWINAYEYYTELRPIDSLNQANHGEKELLDIGRIMHSLQEYPIAEKSLEEALKLNPYNVRIKGYLIDIYGEQKKYDKAIQILDEWVKQNPEDKAALNRLAIYKLEQDKQKKQANQ